MAEDSERTTLPFEGSEECSPSTSETLRETDSAQRAMTTSDRKALGKMRDALRTKILELEEVEAEEKETLKATKKAVREVQRILSNKEIGTDVKVEQFQQKYLQQVSEQIKVEKGMFQCQKKLDKITAEKAALSEEMHRMTQMNLKLQDLCRTLQSQNKTVVQEAQTRAMLEAQQREQLSERLETSMKEISTKLEDHSVESQKCITENTELRAKLREVSRFCDDMEQTHQAQLTRKDVQIKFFQERLSEQAELISHHERAEVLLQEKCKASEEARDTYSKQLENAKEKISGFCTSFEQSNKAFKQLQSQVDVSNKIQKKMQQEADLLRKRSDILQRKSDKLTLENEKLTEQVNTMRAKLDESIPSSDHHKIKTQKEALEKLCRALQSELHDLRLTKNAENDPSIPIVQDKEQN